MTRLAAVLLAILVACGLSVVSSQHRARKMFVASQAEQDRAQQLEDEWGQLQLEQRTWAISTRVENIARTRLHMNIPEDKRIHSLPAQGEMHAEVGKEAGR